MGATELNLPVYYEPVSDNAYLEDFYTYMELFQSMANFMKKPNIIVHLDLTPEESQRRIKLRSRDCESGVPLEYLQALHAAYEAFISDIARVIPVIKVDYSRFRTAEEMAAVVKAEYAKIANVRHVSFGPAFAAEPTTPPPAALTVMPAPSPTLQLGKPVGHLTHGLRSVLKVVLGLVALRTLFSLLRLRRGAR